MNRRDDMEIKVGQWARRNDNRIFEITPTLCLTNSDWQSKELGYIDNLKKVANTPQELVKVGDLIITNNISKLQEIRSITCWNGDWLEYNHNTRVHKNDIIKILTPNANGGYDLQWKSNE